MSPKCTNRWTQKLNKKALRSDKGATEAQGSPARHLLTFSSELLLLWRIFLVCFSRTNGAPQREISMGDQIWTAEHRQEAPSPSIHRLFSREKEYDSSTVPVLSSAFDPFTAY